MNRSISPTQPLNTSSSQLSKRYVSPSERQQQHSTSPNERVDKSPQARKASNPIFGDQRSNYQLGGMKESQSSQAISAIGGAGGLGQSFFSQQPVVAQNVGQSRMSVLSQNPSAYVYIPCPSHPDLFITNICRDRVINEECVEPLCPECITGHIELHGKRGTLAKIENIQRVRKECQSFLQATKERIQKITAGLKVQQSQQLQYQECLDQMREVRQKLTEVLDEYFEGLEKDLKQKLRGLESQREEFLKAEERLAQEAQALANLNNELQGSNYVRLVIQVLEQQEQMEIAHKVQQIEEAAKNYQMQLPQVCENVNHLEHLRDSLKKYVYLSSRKEARWQPVSGAPETAQRSAKSGEQYQSVPAVTSRDELQINAENHFGKEAAGRRAIVRLEEDGRKVFILNLETSRPEVSTGQLTSQLRVPMNHRVITTDQGMHLMTGGVFRDKNRFKSSDQVFEVDLSSMTLVPHSNMGVNRAMHALCQLGQFVYAVGGTTSNDENSSTSKCERLDLATRVWTPIPDCKVQSCGSALVAIRNRYLAKIGGKIDLFTPSTMIEVFDTKEQRWSELAYHYTSGGYLRLPFNSCATNIGGNRILLFGGSVHDVKTKECQIISVPQGVVSDGEAAITQFKPIPSAVEFSTQLAIVEQNTVFVLQEGDSGRRNLLSGSGAGWREI